MQEFDQLARFKPITKWAAVCGRPEEIAQSVAAAFRHALAPPRGPVYLELPMDVLFAIDSFGSARGEAAYMARQTWLARVARKHHELSPVAVRGWSSPCWRRRYARCCLSQA
jgi:thiamine pyrophosphate-dependent acetolactate synthase large subunit-like protein